MFLSQSKIIYLRDKNIRRQKYSSHFSDKNLNTIFGMRIFISCIYFYFQSIVYSYDRKIFNFIKFNKFHGSFISLRLERKAIKKINMDCNKNISESHYILPFRLIPSFYVISLNKSNTHNLLTKAIKFLFKKCISSREEKKYMSVKKNIC